MNTNQKSEINSTDQSTAELGSATTTVHAGIKITGRSLMFAESSEAEGALNF